MIITAACSMAFAHGSNDVANAIGPLAAIYSVVESGGELIGAKSALPVLDITSWWCWYCYWT